MPEGPRQTPVIQNKKASFNFEILEKLEAGISLTGSEVKSLRDGRASLDEAFAVIRDSEVYLRGFNVSPYPMATYGQHQPTRERKLLLHRRQIRRWENKVILRGLTLIPLSVYFSERGLVKISLALARGKTHSDKRADLKRREDRREMDRAMKRRS
jgi:SsrA-binding protein